MCVDVVAGDAISVAVAVDVVVAAVLAVAAVAAVAALAFSMTCAYRGARMMRRTRELPHPPTPLLLLQRPRQRR